MSSSPSELKGDPLKNEVVRAGAGAGKTTALTGRVIAAAREFQRQNDRLPKVVVTTFTRKATQELRERLMSLASESGDPSLLSFTSSKSQLMISTIHGVLSQFLNRFGYLLEMDPGYRIESAPAIYHSARTILREILFESEERQQMLERFEFQRLCQMFLHYSENQLVSAQLKPHDEQSFTRIYLHRLEEAAENVLRVVEEIEAEAETENWQLYAQDLRRAAAELLTGSLQQRAECFALRFQGLKKPRKTKKNPGISDLTAEKLKEAVQEIQRFLAVKREDRFLDFKLWPKFFAEMRLFEEVAQEFHRRFYRHKMETGQLSMSDLETLSWRLIQEHPTAAEQFQKEWDYWLVDEYQDTSPLQERLLKQLIGQRPQFTVGDPQQSIYIFRGAHSELFAEKEQELRMAGGEVEFLQKNYRSQPALLEFFNDFFESLGEQFSRMQPREPVSPEESSSQVATFALIPASPSTYSDEEEGGGTSAEKGEPEDDEIRALTGQLRELLDRGAQLDEICILGRTNRFLERAALLLSQWGYPVHLHSASGFYSRREVLDALAFLKFLSNPHDDQNLVLLLRSPWLGVEDSLLAASCAKKSAELSLWAHWREEELSGQSLKSFRFLQSLRARLIQCGYVQTLQQAVQEVGLIDWCRRIDPTGRRESNLWKLLFLLSQEERRPGFNVNRFAEGPRSSASTEEGEQESDAVAALEPNRIHLMTVHSSKGLQFKHVLVVGLHAAPRLAVAQDFSVDNDGRWAIPLFDEDDHSHIAAISSVEEARQLRERELKEQERLLYVAMTRAKESIYLSWQEPAKRKSLADSLTWNLEEGEHQRSHYRYSVRRSGFELYTYSASSQMESRVRDAYSLSSTKERRVDSLSVSRLLDQLNVDDVKSPSLSRDSQELSAVIPSILKTREGVRVHRLFELLRHLSPEELASTVEQWRQKEPGIAQAIDYVFSLSSPPMRSLLSHGKVEWGFVCRLESYLLEGKVDLWGVVDGNLWIVDYKTGSSSRVEKAFRQLCLYAHGLRQAGQQEPIKLAVVYPLEGSSFVRDEEFVTKELGRVQEQLSRSEIL